MSGRAWPNRALSTLLASGLAVQALASCGLWAVLLVSRPPCCPLHQPGTEPVVGVACCDAADQSGLALDTSAALEAPGVRVVEPFLAGPSRVDARTTYYLTLPVAARGHTTVSLSALLI